MVFTMILWVEIYNEIKSWKGEINLCAKPINYN